MPDRPDREKGEDGRRWGEEGAAIDDEEEAELATH
jgi:hypothetical protein